MSEAAAATEGWWVQARERAYGPYTAPQMRQFVVEGRVKPQTLISRSREGGWREMRQTELGGAQGLTTAKQAGPELANMFVFAEIHSGAWNQFMAALEAMGRLAELAPGFWLIRTKLSSGVMRNTLSQTLETGDRFVVVDATRDRLAWYNMGPGPEVALRDVWNSTP